MTSSSDLLCVSAAQRRLDAMLLAVFYAERRVTDATSIDVAHQLTTTSEDHGFGVLPDSSLLGSVRERLMTKLRKSGLVASVAGTNDSRARRWLVTEEGLRHLAAAFPELQDELRRDKV